MKLYWCEATAILTLGKVAMMYYLEISWDVRIFSFNNQNNN